MNNIMKQIIHMKASLMVNAFIYYFRKLWVIGTWMPETFYSSYTVKKRLGVAAVILRQVMDFFSKPLYLVLFMGIPYLLFRQKQPQLDGQGFAVLVHILFFLSCYIGAFGDNHIFAVSRDKVTFIKYMKMNVRDYTISSLAFRYIPFFLYYLPCLIGAALLLDSSVWEGVAAWLLFLCFRMAGEAFQLFIFDRTGKVLSRNMIYEWILIGTGLFMAYYLPYQGLLLPTQLLFHPVSVLLYLVCGGFFIYYITIGYRGYEKKLPRSIDLNFLLSNMLKTSSGASFKEVEIKDRDLDLSRTGGRQFEHLHGYEYMNALFFARHRRQLLRPVYYRLLMVGLVFTAGIFFHSYNPVLAAELSRNMSASLLPFLVFLMYCISVADKACKAMFYNCDMNMLHYAFYRTPRTILTTFRVRLLRVSLLNLIVALALCLAAVAFCILCGTSIFTLDMMLLCITVLLLSILFTAHHLCLYYIFQPYSESLKIKNPFFSVINTVMYMICLLCLQIEVGGPVFSGAVLIFTVLYILIVLVIVYYRAPKSFRVK